MRILSGLFVMVVSVALGSIGASAQATAQRTAQRTATASEAFDVVIINGHIVDGSGSPWYSGQIGIRAGRIAAIGSLENWPRKQTIDARGKVVAPGFIDMLGQSELTMLVDPRLPSKIFQGITTEVTGEGNSAVPLNAAMTAADRAGFEHLRIAPDWTTFREYFARLERQGMDFVLVNGVPVIADGKMTGALPGKVLRGPGYVAR